MKKKYKWIHGTLNYPDQQILAENCNAIIFRNTGVGTVLINGDPLPLGDALTLSGWENEVDVSTYQIQWNGLSSGTVQYWRKFYES
jgi:hypothetical protein